MISVKFTARELELLSTLASDQLFRREFIDPRIPGHKVNSVDLDLGKRLVERLRLKADPTNRAVLLKKNALEPDVAQNVRAKVMG